MDEWITVKEAAERLKVTIRQANRYGHGEAPRLRTRKAGKRILYHRGDVEALADELGVAYKPRSQEPSTDLVPVGEMLDYLRDRDHRVEQLQAQLLHASHRIGELETLLNQRLLPDAVEELRRRLAEAEASQVSRRAPRSS